MELTEAPREQSEDTKAHQHGLLPLKILANRPYQFIIDV